MIYDISVPIGNDTPVYAGDPGIELVPMHSIDKGDSANVSLLKLGLHSGTHMDPPRHFINDGATIDELPLDVLIGDCVLREIDTGGAITVERLESADIPAGVERILFKTRSSQYWNDNVFHTDFAHLSPEAADWLVDRGVKLVGIDYLSIEVFHSPTHAVHRRLLGAGVVVVEGLDLRQVSSGTYTLICLPLKVKGGDGGPTRAVLMTK